MTSPLHPIIVPSPDHPGWTTFDFPDPTRYNQAVIGGTLVRVEGERTCRVRFQPKPHLTNQFDQLHGGGILGIIDVSLFAGLRFIADHHTGGVTLDLSTQFLSAGRAEEQTDVVLEVLRNTRNLLFVRGTVEQAGDNLVAAFSGTIRKIDAAKAR